MFYRSYGGVDKLKRHVYLMQRNQRSYPSSSILYNIRDVESFIVQIWIVRVRTG